jgi:hypothetical protein
MSNVRTVDPAIEPVSLAQVKEFGKLPETTLYDNTLTLMITAAREHFELTTGLALIEQTWRMSLDNMPGASSEEPWWDGVREGAISELTPARNWVELPTAPLRSVTSFQTFNEINVPALFTSFYTDLDSKPGRVILNFGAVWPTSLRPTGKYVITYKAGFGTASENVPADIRLCISQLALHFNENPEALTFDTAAVKVPIHCERIMTRRKLKRIS